MSGPIRTVLILGGYGTFGGRLAQLLSDEGRLRLIIAGRSLDKANAFCARVSGAAQVEAAVVDRDGDIAAQIATLKPDFVVDAMGPYQIYGDDPYRVVKAALSCGAHYLDLADGTDFVDGVPAFDQQAKEAGLFVLSGVSSFPVLSCAVLRKLAKGMERLDAVQAGIAPSPFAGVGLNVIRAIASYAGKPIGLLRDGQEATGYGLCETRKFTIAVPGKIPLRPLPFSLVDVPDLKVLPRHWPELKEIWMGAGPVPIILHRMLNGFAHLVRLRLLPSLVFMAPLMDGVMDVLRWGEHRGGMFVRASGIGHDGRELVREWHLVAEGNDGPFIPSMAIEAIIRKALAGAGPPPGARAATAELELEDYIAGFANKQIYSGFREAGTRTDGQPLYTRMLGEALDRLPEQIRKMHTMAGDATVAGQATVERGRGFLSRVIGLLAGFPTAGSEVPVEVTFKKDGAREIWRRRFDGKNMISTQEAGSGRYERLLVERFGPLSFGLAVVVDNGKLRLIMRRWAMFGLPMPMFLAPEGTFFEHNADDRFNFHVEMRAPLVGHLVSYRGWLVPMS